MQISKQYIVKYRYKVSTANPTIEDRELLYLKDRREIIRGLSSGFEKLNGWEIVSVSSLPTTIGSILGWLFYRVSASSSSYINLPVTTYLSVGWTTRIENKSTSTFALAVNKYGGGWSLSMPIGSTYEFMWDGASWNAYNLTLDNKAVCFLGTTTNATPTEIFINGIANSRLIISSGKAIMYRIRVACYNVSNYGNTELWEKTNGIVKNYLGTTVMSSGNPTLVASTSQPITNGVTLGVNDTLDALTVSVTGTAGYTWRWKGLLEYEVV